MLNRNLIGVGPVGCMTADQKKKLLWGNKKSTTAEEVGHRWDTTLFSDRERQEKFNKLMGVKGEVKVGTETRERRSEAEGTPNGFREAVHCWTAKKRWPYCWIRSLSILTFLRTVKTPGYSVVLLCKTVLIHVPLFIYGLFYSLYSNFVLDFVRNREQILGRREDEQGWRKSGWKEMEKNAYGMRQKMKTSFNIAKRVTIAGVQAWNQSMAVVGCNPPLRRNHSFTGHVFSIKKKRTTVRTAS
ncbi:unnamed protein product [Prunus armeniaca]|uniref:Small acidic protein-like domain-containing protein n=1 Tax=Prunus armeniaca TaxID=36596 RepID=A0A6J5XZW0_PRUAR|nr:unnamed protein product [Prunus armeniaca]